MIGTCPANPSNLKCQPNGDCQICNYISDNYVGCAITSITPVCDSDASTSGTQTDYSNPATTRECVACKKSGKMRNVTHIYSNLNFKCNVSNDITIFKRNYPWRWNSDRNMSGKPK